MDTSRTDIALLLVRAVVGVSFLLHGLDKLGDLSGTEGNFDGLGIPAPAIMAPFVAVLETVGGIALLLGVLSPVFALMLVGNMVVGGLTAHVGNGFFVADGGFELVLLLGAASAAIVFAGAGRFSVDHALRLGRLPGFPELTPHR